MLPGVERRRIGAEPHGAAEIAVGCALLELVAAQPLGQQADDRLRRRAELGGVGVRDAGERAGRLDHRHLHAEADAEIRHLALAGEARRLDLALGAALAEAAGHEDAVDALEEGRRILALEDLALDPVEVDLHPVGDAAMDQRLDQRLVGVLEAGVLADDGDGDLALRVVDALGDRASSGSRSGAGASAMPKAASTSLSSPSA